MNAESTEPGCAHYLDEPIPVVPSGVAYLLNTLNDDGLTTAQLAAALEKFPSIAARLLAVANSAWSSPGTEITDLQNACVRLGLMLVRSLSLALAVANVFDPHKCRAFDGRRYWLSALLAAEAASRLAGSAASADRSGAWRAAALMHNIGLLWLADRRPEETDGVLADSAPGELMARMQADMGVDHCQAGACLAQAWGLPNLFVEIISHHREDHFDGEHAEAVAAVGIAARIGSALARECEEDPTEAGVMSPFADLPDLVDDLGRQRERLKEVASAIASAG